MSYHHYTKTNAETVAATIKAGCNLELGKSGRGRERVQGGGVCVCLVYAKEIKDFN